MIIAISGRIGSGKDTIGKIIQILMFLKRHRDAGGKDEYIFNDKSWNWQSAIDKDFPYGNEWEIKKFADALKDIVSILTGISRADLEKQEVKDRYLPEMWNKYFNERFDFMGNSIKTITTEQNPEVIVQRMTARDMLQKIGTEAMRDVIHNNVWVNALFSKFYGLWTLEDKEKYFRYKGFDNITKLKIEDPDTYYKIKELYFRELNASQPKWIITDLRFPNEFDAVKERGGICVRVNRTINDVVNGKLHASETSLDHIKDWDYVIDNNGTMDELIQKVKEMLIHFKLL